MEISFIFIIGACLAAFVQGLTGFAFALIAMSFWVWVLPPQISAPLVVFASLWCHIISLSKEQPIILKRSLVYVYIVAGLIGVPLGTFLLNIINAEIFKLILGLFLIVWCPVMYVAPQFKSIQQLGSKADASIGLIGGVLGGLGGFCGAVPSAWVMLKNLPKQHQRYILRHFNFAIQLFTIAVYLWQGTISTELLKHFGILILIISIPAILGAQLFYKISERQFKQIVLSLLFTSGCILLISSIHQLKLSF